MTPPAKPAQKPATDALTDTVATQIAQAEESVAELAEAVASVTNAVSTKHAPMPVLESEAQLENAERQDLRAPNVLAG